MTNKELNRDINRLWNAYYSATFETQEVYFQKLEKLIKPELHRLYHADTDFTALTLKSIKILTLLNVKLRVIPLHMFGAYIKI